MTGDTKKIKLVIFFAIVLVLFLVAIVVVQLVNIQKLKTTIEQQNKEISSKQNQIEYYSNQNSESEKDEKNNDVEFIVEGD